MSKNEEKTVGACNAGVVTLDDFAVRFSGDSGDGMQLAGNIFSTVSAIAGNDICTFPNYPADIRAPRSVGVPGTCGRKKDLYARRQMRPARGYERCRACHAI